MNVELMKVYRDLTGDHEGVTPLGADSEQARTPDNNNDNKQTNKQASRQTNNKKTQAHKEFSWYLKDIPSLPNDLHSFMQIQNIYGIWGWTVAKLDIEVPRQKRIRQISDIQYLSWAETAAVFVTEKSTPPCFTKITPPRILINLNNSKHNKSLQ